MSLSYVKTVTIAEEMIKRGARPPIISATLDLSKDMVRGLWKDIHGVSPKKGMCPNNSVHKLKSRSVAVHANIFFLVYARRGKDVLSTAEPENIIRAFDAYCDSLKYTHMTPLLDFTTAWYIARDLRSSILNVKNCRKCRVNFLFSVENPSLRSCPYCYMTKKIEPVSASNVIS